jgi:hypothetical protein
MSSVLACIPEGSPPNPPLRDLFRYTRFKQLLPTLPKYINERANFANLLAHRISQLCAYYDVYPRDLGQVIQFWVDTQGLLKT